MRNMVFGVTQLSGSIQDTKAEPQQKLHKLLPAFTFKVPVCASGFAQKSQLCVPLYSVFTATTTNETATTTAALTLTARILRLLLLLLPLLLLLLLLLLMLLLLPVLRLVLLLLLQYYYDHYYSYSNSNTKYCYCYCCCDCDHDFYFYPPPAVRLRLSHRKRQRVPISELSLYSLAFLEPWQSKSRGRSGQSRKASLSASRQRRELAARLGRGFVDVIGTHWAREASERNQLQSLQYEVYRHGLPLNSEGLDGSGQGLGGKRMPTCQITSMHSRGPHVSALSSLQSPGCRPAFHTWSFPQASMPCVGIPR